MVDTITPSAADQQQNLMARKLVLDYGLDVWLQVYNTSLVPTLGQVINISPRPVGFVKRFVVQVAAQITNSTGGESQTLQPFGMSNFFSNFTVTDLSNQVRINTQGWHLAMVSSAKRRRVFGGANILNTGGTTITVPQLTVFGFGNAFQGTSTSTLASNSQLMYAASLAAATGGFVFSHYELPISYDDIDLRGAIYAGVTSATMNVQLVVNANMFAGSGATDSVFSLYKSSAATSTAALSTTKITLYQNIIDQVPIGQNGGPILPLIDISTAYMLQNTSVGNLIVNMDNPVFYANFRSFLSTTVIYDNAGTLNTGSDIGYFALQSANFTNIFKFDPFTAALRARSCLGADPPKGMYYFDHRMKPIYVIQYGNMALVVNPTNVGGATATLSIGYEMLAKINEVTQSGSLYGT